MLVLGRRKRTSPPRKGKRERNHIMCFQEREEVTKFRHIYEQKMSQCWGCKKETNKAQPAGCESKEQVLRGGGAGAHNYISTSASPQA